MPRGTNATLLTLTPKKNPPETIKDFRPISCCNVLYKIISKLLAERLKQILPAAIEPNQSAFITDRLLLENILLATELVTDYHRQNISPRCAIKVDIAKAFDTLRWVITSIANFWCSVFRLPTRCLTQIESMCAAFLWSGSPTITTKSKVAWNDLCLPKEEGGLGLRRLKDTSRAYSLSLIWRLLTSTNSYWVVWTKQYLLRHSSFWDMKRNTRGSWIWNKLLKLRPIAATFLRHGVGNGRNTFFWLDNWLGTGSLIQLVGEVGPSIMGIARHASVADVVRNGTWALRYHRNPLVRDHVIHILTLPVPQPTDSSDTILWHQGSDIYKDSYSMKMTWNQIRQRKEKKGWTKLVWSHLSIPCYSFITWLAMLDKLPTGSRMHRWGQIRGCILCGDQWESREHLFFQCSYSYTVWTELAAAFLSTAITPVWSDIIVSLLDHRQNREVTQILCFLFQATIYHVWRERNCRNHGSAHTPPIIISSTIRNLFTLRIQAQNFDNERQTRLWTAWSTR